MLILLTLARRLKLVGREGIRTPTELTAVLQTVELTHVQPTQLKLILKN